MPHFYLHLSNGSGDTRDEEGIDLPDLQAARSEAVSSIRSILKDELALGSLDLDGHVRIADGNGNVLCDVPFTEAVDIRRPGQG